VLEVRTALVHADDPMCMCWIRAGFLKSNFNNSLYLDETVKFDEFFSKKIVSKMYFFSAGLCRITSFLFTNKLLIQTLFQAVSFSAKFNENITR